MPGLNVFRGWLIKKHRIAGAGREWRHYQGPFYDQPSEDFFDCNERYKLHPDVTGDAAMPTKTKKKAPVDETQVNPPEDVFRMWLAMKLPIQVGDIKSDKWHDWDHNDGPFHTDKELFIEHVDVRLKPKDQL
jgi:hypothetical protein